jgi:peptide/nickel transport system substrate-binding protein
MRRLRGLAVAATAVAMATVAAGCSSAPTHIGKGSKVTGQLVRGGTVTVAAVGAVPNFIFPYPPATNSDGYNANLTFGLWPALVYAGDGAKSIVNPQESMYSSLAYSHNDSVITIVLKPWKWSDGAPLTSRDFTFTYNLVKANYTNWNLYATGLFPVDVKSVSTPDAHTVVMTLTRSYNPQFYTDDVLSTIALMPQHSWDKTSVTGKIGNYDSTTAGAHAVWNFLQKQGGDIATFTTNPLWKVVDGPWHLGAFNTNGYYSWVPNKSYSGPDKPFLNQVAWTPFTTDIAEMNTLRSGTSLGMAGLPANDINQVSALEAEGYSVASQPIPGVAEIVPNMYNPVVGPMLSQLYIRQVLEDLINRPQIVSKVYGGHADPGNGPVPVLIGSGWASPLEQQGGPYPYSPAKAIALLKAHGWKVAPNGVSTCATPGTGATQCGAGIKANEPLQFQLIYSSGRTSTDEMEAAIVSTEAAAGVKIVLKPEPFNTIASTVGSCQNAKAGRTAGCSWQLLDYGYNPYSLDPSGAGMFNTGGINNYGGYANAKEDQLINATEYGSSQAAFYAYEDYTAEQLPFLWLPLRTVLLVYKKNLAGIAPLNPFSGGLNPEVWHYVKPGT